MAKAPVPLVSSHSLFNIAVSLFRPVSGLREALTYLARDHDAPMVSTGAAERNGEIAFPLADIMRQQIDQQVGDARNKFRGLRKGPDITRHARMLAGEMFERRNVIRVRKEANVEDQVTIGRNAVPVSEAVHLH